MVNLKRELQKKIQDKLFKKKVIIIYGPRQSGKTTLSKTILKANTQFKSLYLNADEPDTRAAFTNKNSSELKAILGDSKLIVLDEAQRIKNIGLSLKLLVDNYPDIQIIATGSSSFELSNSIVEPLTGRKYEFHLYPLAFSELDSNPIELKRHLNKALLYGMYPEVTLSNDPETRIKEISNSYLFKDILNFQDIRNPELLMKLLQALALQIGSEVSYNEISGLLGIDKNTVRNYITLLERAFIIFKLTPFSRNLRNELKKKRKIYFYDLGIRNSIISNFVPIEFRTDKGALFENLMLSERIKKLSFSNSTPNQYFWRTHDGQKIDYLEEEDAVLRGFEFKWKNKSYKTPIAFQKAYPDSKVECVNTENFLKFIN